MNSSSSKPSVAFVSLLALGGCDVACFRLANILREYGHRSQVYAYQNHSMSWPLGYEFIGHKSDNEIVDLLNSYDVVITIGCRVFDMKRMYEVGVPREILNWASCKSKRIFYTAGDTGERKMSVGDRIVYETADGYMASREDQMARVMTQYKTSHPTFEMNGKPRGIFLYPVTDQQLTNATLAHTRSNWESNRFVFPYRFNAPRRYKQFFRTMQELRKRGREILIRSHPVIMGRGDSFAMSDVRAQCGPFDQICTEKIFPTHDLLWKLYRQVRHNVDWSAFVYGDDHGFQNVSYEAIMHNVVPIVLKGRDPLEGLGQYEIECDFPRITTEAVIQSLADQIEKILDDPFDAYEWRVKVLKRHFAENHHADIIYPRLVSFFESL